MKVMDVLHFNLEAWVGHRIWYGIHIIYVNSIWSIILSTTWRNSFLECCIVFWTTAVAASFAHRYNTEQGSFFRLHVPRKHPKIYYKRYKNSRIFLDEKAKCQPWIIKKKPNFGWRSQNWMKIGEFFSLHP
jgi:hypothetical protein